ncbi:MarR family winged helix-turn-helix transcriptional regulator [Undibacterium arcticum]|uniref:MarR family winged helix-turn-helix transcriptional regulator n=1 Tax=Undibacterium arcticum TaxID=1762892 RepID=A0ABV7EZN0_9BURK
MANNVHKIPRPSGEQNEIQRELSRMIGEVSRGWRQQMNLRLKPFGLNLSMRQVLLQLHRNPGGLQQKELAHKLGIEGPTLVRLLDQLERNAWIQRLTAVHDKRRKDVVLTAKATEQIRIIEQLSYALSSEMTADLDQVELASCLAAMTTIRNNLQK